ncbi:MAG: hypothetical protein GC152_08675 [Alphaproteobacteria bacterium]|nr:hypothetical protein [Alphaproteobacteria bacterium]
MVRADFADSHKQFQKVLLAGVAMCMAAYLFNPTLGIALAMMLAAGMIFGGAAKMAQSRIANP